MKWIAHVNQPTNLCLLSGWDLLSWFLRWFKDNLNIIYKEKRSNKTFFVFWSNKTRSMAWSWSEVLIGVLQCNSLYMISTLFVANDSWTSNAHLASTLSWLYMVTCRFCIIMRQRAVRLHHIEVWWLPRQTQLIDIIIVAKPKFLHNISCSHANHN
jgi:hypothetical protein